MKLQRAVPRPRRLRTHLAGCIRWFYALQKQQRELVNTRSRCLNDALVSRICTLHEQETCLWAQQFARSEQVNLRCRVLLLVQRNLQLAGCIRINNDDPYLYSLVCISMQRRLLSLRERKSSPRR